MSSKGVCLVAFWFKVDEITLAFHRFESVVGPGLEKECMDHGLSRSLAKGLSITV